MASTPAGTIHNQEVLIKHLRFSLFVYQVLTVVSLGVVICQAIWL
jgi:hypothetical protein